MALPATAILDSIRALRGKARVTFPEGNKRMERIATFPKGDWQLALLSADPDDSNCKLTDQQKLKEDNQLVEVYRVYDKLPGVELSGQEYEADIGVLIPYKMQKVASGTAIGLESTQVEPINAAVDSLRSYVPADVGEALAGFYMALGDLRVVTLPDKLISGEVVISYGNGVGSGSSASANISGSISSRRGHSAQSSGSASCDIAWVIEHGFSGPVAATQHLFFLPIAAAGFDAVKTALRTKTGNATLDVWPTIKRRTESVVVIGGRKSQRVSEEYSASIGSGVATSSSSSTDYDTGVSASSVVVPETIHGEVSITSDTHGTAPIGSIAVTAGAFPSSLGPTSPVVFPTGEYIMEISVSPYKHGYARVIATTVTINSGHV